MTSDPVSKRPECTCGTCEPCCAVAVVKAAHAYGVHLHKRGGSIEVKVKLSGKKKL